MFAFCSGSNDPKNCELAKAYAGYANRQRMKALEEEQAKQMTFEKLLEEQRHRLHSVGHSQHNNQTQNSADSDVTFDLASSSSVNSSSSTTSTAGAPLLKANGEFYEVFSKVRAKTATSSSSSSSNGEPSSSQAASFDLAPKAFAKAVWQTADKSTTTIPFICLWFGHTSP